MFGKRILKYLQKYWTGSHKLYLHLKLSRCEFLKPEEVYLGLRISAEGLQPVEEKINAVKRVTALRYVSELRSFPGMFQYYHSFLPRIATTLASLQFITTLLKKKKNFKRVTASKNQIPILKLYS